MNHKNEFNYSFSIVSVLNVTVETILARETTNKHKISHGLIENKGTCLLEWAVVPLENKMLG